MAGRVRRASNTAGTFSAHYISLIHPAAGSNARRILHMKLSIPEGVTGQLCRICQRNPPIKKSHVLPKFLWKESGLAHRSDNQRCRLIYKANQQKFDYNPLNSGLTEPLFCSSCEGERGKFETYMAQVLYHDNSVARTPSNGHRVINGLSYEQVKLFTMYNLFAMGVSNQPYYASARLGEAHTERLRQMLLASDPGEPWRYSSIWFRLKIADEPLEGVSIAPSAIRWGDSGQVVYRTVMAGICWMTFCSNHPHPGLKEPLFIGPSGSLVLFDAKPNELRFVAHRIDEWLVSQGSPAIYSRGR